MRRYATMMMMMMMMTNNLDRGAIQKNEISIVSIDVVQLQLKRGAAKDTLQYTTLHAEQISCRTSPVIDFIFSLFYFSYCHFSSPSQHPPQHPH